MSTDYYGLINGFHNPIEIAHTIQKTYGGSNFSIDLTSVENYYRINFNEEESEEVKKLSGIQKFCMPKEMRPENRSMSIFVFGECKSDYADITTEQMTFFSLGRWGDAKMIIDALVMEYGGYIKDEAGSQEWERL